MITLNTVLHTDGSGYWSNHKAAVRVTDMELAYVDQTADFGELKVYFDEQTWDTEHHGLIYSDGGFCSELKAVLNEMGINGVFDYSEQGMQGEDYVSFDVGSTFITEFTTMLKECA